MHDVCVCVTYSWSDYLTFFIYSCLHKISLISDCFFDVGDPFLLSLWNEHTHLFERHYRMFIIRERKNIYVTMRIYAEIINFWCKHAHTHTWQDYNWRLLCLLFVLSHAFGLNESFHLELHKSNIFTQS
jgi:hypothetical protein